MASQTKKMGREIPTYQVSTYMFVDVEALNEVPFEIFTSKRFHSIKAVFGDFLYTFELSLLDLNEDEDPDVAVTEGTLLPLTRVPLSPTSNETDQFPLPALFRDFFQDYEHNGFILSGEDFDGRLGDLQKVSTEPDVLIDFDQIVKQLEFEGKIEVSPTESWFARDQRRFCFTGETEDSYDFDCLGTTACQSVTDRLCDLYQGL